MFVDVSGNTELGSVHVYDMAKPGKIKALLAGHLGCCDRADFHVTSGWSPPMTEVERFRSGI